MKHAGWFAVTFLVLLAGCAREPLAIYLDNATADERAATEAAVARLNPYAASGRAIILAPSRGASTYLLSFAARIPTKDGDMLGRECTHEGTDCPEARSIRILRGMNTDLLVHVIAHEIGHAWQLPHLPPRAMMAPHIEEASHFFTNVDQAACVDVKECASTPAAPPPLPAELPGARTAAPERRID